ncbi:MAG: FAD:protein FMN transferase [Bacteroidetes bacterium]|nr:FAD:protein FMN transferase [Bacteroidota bacterium]
MSQLIATRCSGIQSSSTLTRSAMYNTSIPVQVRYKRSIQLHNTRFEFGIMAGTDEEGWANNCIDAAINETERIYDLLSPYAASSGIAAVNSNAGIAPVKVPAEIVQLTLRAVALSQLTNGAFDITGTLAAKKIWNYFFQHNHFPDTKTIKRFTKLANYNNIEINADACTIALKEKGMRLSFDDIVKGYVAERSQYLLEQNGVADGYINIGGDITAWGFDEAHTSWTISSIHPAKAHLPFSYLGISDKTISSSANEIKPVLINGKYFLPIIDYKTGMPVRGIKSISIVSSDAVAAAALVRAISIMGIAAGLELAEHNKDISCIITDETDLIYTSANILEGLL